MSFADELARFSDKALDRANAVRQKVALGVFGEVIEMSPVDTGRFRGNWQTSVGDYSRSAIENLDPSGRGTTGRMTLTVLASENDKPLYLVNNLPYAQRLEYGWSKQAPQGMVRLTVQKFEKFVKQAVRARE